MNKTVDLNDVKMAIENDQLKIYISYTPDGVARIMMRDTDTYETVELENDASRSHKKNDIIEELEWYLSCAERVKNVIKDDDNLSLAYNKGYISGIKSVLEVVMNGTERSK